MGAGVHGPADERANPFVQVALGSMYDPNAVTIRTSAVERALSIVSEYLSAPTAPGAGKILAVTGEHGMGKTHLAKHVIHRAENTPGVRVRTLYLLASNHTFVELYKDLAENLLKQSGPEVPDLIRRVYAGIVAAELKKSVLGEGVAEDLENGRRDPVVVVDAYRLAESDLLDALEDRLRVVTSNRDFSRALTLMLRPEFESSVREWLLGHPPDSLLRDRGLRRSIDTEEIALEAMGVFAVLYEQAGVPLLLVIDELERILLRRDRPGEDVISAFQQFLEKTAAAGAFLVLVGLPDSLEELPESVKQRIGEPIRMAPFTGDDVASFIADSHPGAQGPSALEPFTSATIDYLVDMVGGVARAVIRLGYRLVQRALAKGVDVTPAMIRETLREEYDIEVPRLAHREIENVLNAAAWPYDLNRRVGRPSVTADYWVTLADDVYCAVLITESILDIAEVEALERRIEAIQLEPFAVEVILIAVGILPRDWADRLASALRGRPVLYDARTFGDEFENAFRSAVERLGLSEQVVEPGDQVTSSAVGRLARQQTNMFRLLGRTATSMDGFRASADREFAAIQRILQDIASRPGTATADVAVTTLPADVDELFGEADAALYRVPQVEKLFEAALRIDERSSELPIRPTKLRSPAIQRAAGVGFLLQQWLTAFRTSVNQWHAAAVTREPAQRDWERFDAVCESFDAVYGELPVLAVDDLVELIGPGSNVPALEPSAPSVTDAINRLGWKVQRQMRRSLGAAG